MIFRLRPEATIEAGPEPCIIGRTTQDMTELLVRLDKDRQNASDTDVALTVLVVLTLVGAVGYIIDRSVDDEETARARQEEERSR